MNQRKLIMTLLVRDEADIIAENIEFHRAQGVDHFFITDNLSVDETPEILARYERLGWASIIRESDDDYNQTKWVTRMAREAAHFGDDDAWVINCDADEFWVAPGSRLKEFFLQLAQPVNSVLAPRHDFTFVYHLDAAEDANEKWHQRMIHRKRISTNHLGRPLMPKMAHRALNDIIVEQGNHLVCGFDELVTQNEGLEILHFPVRSQEQFEHKILNGGNAYLNNTSVPNTVGKGWRDLHSEMEKNGNLETYLQSYGLEYSQVASNVADGHLIVDLRIRDFVRHQFSGQDLNRDGRFPS